jgi:hypothetical protein
MDPEKRLFPAPPRGASKSASRLRHLLFAAPLMLFFGCAGQGDSVRQFLGLPPSEPTPEASVAETAAPVATPAPRESESQSHAHKKSGGRDVHVAVEKASQASESAAEASAKAAQASKQAKQAAEAASHAEGGGAPSGKTIVSLEPSPAPASTSTPRADVATGEAGVATPSAVPKNTPSLESVTVASAKVPAVAASGEPNPANAAKLIDDLDKLEKRVDRNNLSADDSQRDILAQRLLQSAKKALADRDSVAAMGLANKASTLLAPLPKVSASIK